MSVASSREQRIKILQRERQFAQEEFPIHLAKLECLLLEYNPFMVLATFAFIDLTYLPEVGRPMNDSDDIEQYHIEIIQALILCHDESEFKNHQFDPPEFQKLRELTVYVGYLHSAKEFPNPSEGSSIEEFIRLHLCSVFKAHNKAVRNWGYEEQTICVLKNLYAPLEGVIEQELGFRVSLLIEAVRAQLQSINQKLQDYFSKTKFFMQQETIEGALEAYFREFNDVGISFEQVRGWVQVDGWTLEKVRAMLFHRSTSFLLEVFAFQEAEFLRSYPAARIQSQKMLSSWTVELGELSESNRDHLFLANPVWLRPIMRANENILFWPIPTLFHSFCFEMMEAIVCKNKHIKEKFHKRRGEFLEHYTSELFRKKFPEAQIFTGSKWVNPNANENGENDLLVIFDSIGLIIEEKSGTINAVAKRGGTSIKQEIEQLITEAAEQAHGFERLLRDNRKQHMFETKTEILNRVDTTNITHLYCLNITMERFGTLATQLPKLQAAGLARKDVQPVPTMCLADLEISLQIFETTYELLHYLTRRAAFELSREFIGDELDLLAFYLRTGFVGKTLENQKTFLVLQGLGKQLDKYFINWPGDARFDKPQRSLSKWWREMLSAIEKKHVHRRYELGCLLLDMPDEEQHAFEAQFQELCRKVKHEKHQTPDAGEAIWNPVKSDVANGVVVAAAVVTEIYPKREWVVQKFAIEAMRTTKTNQAIVILVDVELRHWPYSGLYLLDGKDLMS